MGLEKNIQFATDATFPAGADPWSSTSNKTEPSVQRKEEGFIPEDPIPADELNWLLHYNAKEIARLDRIVTVPDFQKSVRTATMIKAFFNPVLRHTYLLAIAGGTVGKIYKSSNGGCLNTDFVALPEVVTASRYSADYDDDGLVIVTTDVNDFLKVLPTDADTDAPTTTATGFSGGPGSLTGGGEIIYEPVSGLWCAFHQKSTPSRLIRTSPDGITWTNRTSTGYDADKLVVRPATDRTSGRIVVASAGGAANETKIHHSDDGGVTWSLAATLANAFNPDGAVTLSYDPYDGNFVLCVSSTSTDSEVWRSVDGGTTWTKVSSLATKFLGVAPYEGAWAGLVANALGTFPAISTDKGVTWKLLDIRNDGTLAGIHIAGGRLYLAGENEYYRSQLVAEIPEFLIA